MKVLIYFFTLLSIVLITTVTNAKLVEKETLIPVQISGKSYTYRLVAVYDDSLASNSTGAIMVFHGTGGSMPLNKARAYAEKGFVGVAVHYFDYNPNYIPGKRPYTLIKLPIEGFEQAIRWVHGLHPVDKSSVILEGRSRGGSLVLLLGQHYSHLLSGIISEVPALYLYGDRATGNWSPHLPIKTLPISSTEGPSWTLNGKGLPFIRFEKFLQELSLEEEKGGLPIFNYGVGFAKTLVTAKAEGYAEDARILVEKISVPLLVTGGLQDPVWDSGKAANNIKKIRSQSILGRDDIYVIEDAGHSWSSNELEFDFPDGGYNRIIDTKSCKDLTFIEYDLHRADIQKICMNSEPNELKKGIYYPAPEKAIIAYPGHNNKLAQEKLETAKNKFFKKIMN